MDELVGNDPCPSCGALPCDWVDDPHKVRDILIWTIARIREVTGVGMKPMLDELPDAIAAALSATPMQAMREDDGGWIIGGGTLAGDKWRAWQDGFSCWVDDPKDATRYHRREDAEAVHMHDEDAWRVVAYRAALAGGE